MEEKKQEEKKLDNSLIDLSPLGPTTGGWKDGKNMDSRGGEEGGRRKALTDASDGN